MLSQPVEGDVVTGIALDALRQLADDQQFEALRSAAEERLGTHEDPAVFALLALALIQLGDRAGAEQVLKRLTACAAPFDLDARVDLAAAWILIGRMDAASQALEDALVVAPGHVRALARLAFCRLQSGQFDAARDLYQRAAALAPQRLPLWVALTRLYIEAETLAEAEHALARAWCVLAERQPRLPEAAVRLFSDQLHGLRLELWLAAGQTAEAEAWFSDQRDKLEESRWVAFLCGYARFIAGRDRHAEADASLREGLQHYPDNLNLLGQMAELADLQGRGAQAATLLHRALKVAEAAEQPTAGLWARLAGVLLHLDPERARQAAERAIASAEALAPSEQTPESLIQALRHQAQHARAQIESQAQEYDAAERRFQAILAENPWHLPTLQGLGQQQMQRGRLDEAIGLFERVAQIDPAKGQASLINARRLPDDPTLLYRLEQVARQPSLEGSVRPGLLFQLAAAREQLGEYDQAMALAQEANAANRPFLRYNPQTHRQHCARVRHAFCAALYEHRRDCGYRGADARLPVFVLGMPRSGTTLVEQILAGHSQIVGAGELGLIPSRVQGLNRWERHVGSGRVYPDCVDDLSPAVTQGIAQGMIDELKALAVEKPAARHVVDKLPHNFEHVGLIKFLFPEARILSVRRDPRDIALSNFFTDYQAKHGGMGFAYDLEWIGQQLADHNLLMHHWQQLFPGEILEVRYEALIADPETEAKRMLAYIGVDWEPQVLAFNRLERPVKTASVWQVRQPIYRTSTAKWRRYQAHLAPLIQGTNARITWEPIADMATLPAPGLLQDGVAHYHRGDLDGAEYRFKQLLHHLPEHAAATFMVGLIHVRKGHLSDGIAHMEQALERCPWKGEWRADLMQAYRLAGLEEKIARLHEHFPESGSDAWAENGD